MSQLVITLICFMTLSITLCASPVCSMSNNELQLKLLQKLESARIEKMKILQKELDYISKIKENIETPILGQKRRIPPPLHYGDSPNLNHLIDNFSLESDWKDIVAEAETASKNYTLKELFSGKSSSSSSSSQIISSIESDFQGQFFATGGVSKIINIYNLKNYDIVRQIETAAKISCVGWNQFNNNKIFSSDYNGTLSLHDTFIGSATSTWSEHEKRIWSLDTSPIDPNRLITGSDDCYVKVWAEGSRKSILKINVRANVCSVRFHPTDSNIIAASAADHRIFLFDLRKSSRPLASAKDHKKSVSYVRFTEDGDLVSAATDCTLRLWSCGTSFNVKPVRTYAGHLNEKNFVGLSVKNGMFAVGSEDNSVHVYQKYSTSPVLKFTIPNKCPLTGEELPSEPSSFVSCVSWVRGVDSNILLAANSLGAIHVLLIK